MEKCLIVALADNRAIGRGGTMPWHISEDLKFFKKTTMSCPVIMGRTTFESLGRPLPGRRNIILSRTCGEISGAEVVSSLEEAYSLVKDEQKAFVIGGASVYGASLPEIDTMYITHLHTVVEDADTFFPEFDPAEWAESYRSETHTDTETGIRFEFVTYKRVYR